MNYGATLAVMVMLAFCFPLAVRVAALLGMSAAVASAVLWTVVVFALATYAVRWQVGRHSAALEQLAQARAQVQASPEDPRSYFVAGEHLATILLRLGRRREASEIIDRYARLGGAREAEIVALREALGAAGRRKRQTA